MLICYKSRQRPLLSDCRSTRATQVFTLNLLIDSNPLFKSLACSGTALACKGGRKSDRSLRRDIT